MGGTPGRKEEENDDATQTLARRVKSFSRFVLSSSPGVFSHLHHNRHEVLTVITLLDCKIATTMPKFYLTTPIYYVNARRSEERRVGKECRL